MAENKILLSSGGVAYSPAVTVIDHFTNMTSPTTPPSLTVKSSSNSGQNYVEWRAFDGLGSNYGWRSLTLVDITLPQWISINFGQTKPVNTVTLTTAGLNGSFNYMPKDFVVEGSNNGIQWTVLGKYENISWTTTNQIKTFLLNEDAFFREYRITVSKVGVDASYAYVSISEILFSYYDVTYTKVQSSSESDFKTHGMNLATFNTIPPHKLYNFSGDLDILYYTDVTTVTAPKLDKTLNYSPLDELSGKAEFVTYIEMTNESRNLNYTGKPSGQFNHLISLTLADDINSIIPTEINESQIGSIKYVVSPDSITWHSYKNGNWIVVDTSNKMNILSDGMSRSELVLLQRNQLQQIIVDRFSIGILLTESFRTVEEIGVDKIDFGVSIRANNAQVNKADFSILNTTAEINVTFAGNTLSGNVNDIDKGKVQYSISLNGAPYYPSDGSFTILQPSPVNLRITLDPKLILIGQTNTIQVLFRDAWGNTDVWDTTFIGTMTGLLFADAGGNYYSTENGTVLQQLDFGTIIAGQTTLEHEIKLKNTYGYTVKNIRISANQQNFPTGAKLQFGTNLTSFEALDELVLNRQMNDGDDLTFYVRMQTQIGTTPIPSNAFDIEVAADKA